jgi:hypothetical protein
MQFKKFSAGRFSYGKSKPVKNEEDLMKAGVTNV